jgi:hypothetical protein
LWQEFFGHGAVRVGAGIPRPTALITDAGGKPAPTARYRVEERLSKQEDVENLSHLFSQANDFPVVVRRARTS